MRFIQTVFCYFLLLVMVGCGSGTEAGFASFDLVKLDSFEVAHPEKIHGIDFNGSRGVIYNFLEGSLILFDNTGAILKRTVMPQGEPGSMGYIGGLKVMPDGRVLLQSLRGEIGVMDGDLNLTQYVMMPFQPTLSNLRSNVKSMDVRDGQVYVYFPGRGGKNPYAWDYLKTNHLLERIDLPTGTAHPSLRLSPESKFQQEAYFDDAFILVSIRGNSLYFAFDNEPMVYEYDLENGEELVASIPLDARKFVEVSAKPIPLGNTDGVFPAMIDGLFPIERGFMVSYAEGLEKEVLDKIKYPDPQRIKAAQRKVLKIYQYESGWSDEILVPSEIAEVLNFEGIDSDFYAMRNDRHFVGPPSNSITIYRVRLRKK